MERAALLIEDPAGSSAFSSGGSLDDDRVECMLNPNHLIIRRSTGISSRRSLAGAFTATTLPDDPLLCTAGGVTELTLDLLFDVTLSGLTSPVGDVRLITERLSRVAENARSRSTGGLPTRIRFIWGKAWNFPAVIVSLSEKLENFDSSGAPRRSWMRLRLLRSAAELPKPDLESGGVLKPGVLPDSTAPAAPSEPRAPADDDELYEMVGPGRTIEGQDDPSDDDGSPPPTNWLPALAYWLTGDAAGWRALARDNQIANPLQIEPETVVRVPAGGAGRA
jgi:hypothetical protein